MTTIQDRIIKDFRDNFCQLETSPSGDTFHIIAYNERNPEKYYRFLMSVIKEVEEETRKEVINHIDFFADQSRWFVDEDDGVSPIIQTRVIAVEDLQKKLLSITNKEKQK